MSVLRRLDRAADLPPYSIVGAPHGAFIKAHHDAAAPWIGTTTPREKTNDEIDALLVDGATALRAGAGESGVHALRAAWHRSEPEVKRIIFVALVMAAPAYGGAGAFLLVTGEAGPILGLSAFAVVAAAVALYAFSRSLFPDANAGKD